VAADVSVHGRLPLPVDTVRRVVHHVLAQEGRDAEVSVTFLGRDRMRDLNQRYKGRNAATDVLAFALPDPSGVVGDVYLCPWVARREAQARGVALEEEVIRLLVHGTLHVLGYDHPEEQRTESAMWKRQERYVGNLT
jgi:probable rRNA maturation factor